MATATKKLPKGITKTPSGTFRVNVMIDGKRIGKTFHTLEEAKQGLYIARSTGTTDAVVDSSSLNITQSRQESTSDTAWTLQEAVERTFQTVWNGMPSERTNMFNSQAALKFFGEKYPVSKITMDRIDEYMAHCQSIGNANSTVNKKLMCLSRVLRTAHERGKLKVMPKIRLKKEPQNRIRFLSEQEEERLLATVSLFGYADQRDAIECLIYTGFRCSELWRLEKRDVDFNHGTITLWRTKGGRPRTVPIVGKIRPIIEARCARCQNDTDRLFPGSSNAWIRWAWDRVRAHMGLLDDPQFVPHMLRHTCATRLAQRGVSMPVIKEWLGHTSITTTARYAHFAPTDLTNAAKLLC
ncbi:MAG: site-specific integrase [Bilophila sp.]